MKTSNELTRQHFCSKHRIPDGLLTRYNPEKIVKDAQEELLLTMLKSENAIEYPALELHRILMSKGYHFADNIQANAKLYFMVRDMKRYIASDTREKIFADQFPKEDMIVDMFGEQIQVDPSFFVIQGNCVNVIKVKADTPIQTFTEANGKTVKVDERENYESYALMLLARQIRDKYYPNMGCRVEINHLNDDYVKGMEYCPDFFAEDHNNTTEIFDGYFYDRLFEDKYQLEVIEFPETCGGASCSGCSNYNACNRTEPPLVADYSGVTKNPDDVQLSYNQRLIANHNTGSLLVDSGAGAGKTTCIVMKLLTLLRNGADPKEIALFTFTNAAAKEMVDRIKMYTGAILEDPARAGELPDDLNVDEITATTFNGLCQKVIEEHYEELGFQRAPHVIPAHIEKTLIHEIFNRYPMKIPGWIYTKQDKSIYDKSVLSYAQMRARSATDRFLDLVMQVKLAEGYKWDVIDNMDMEYQYKAQLKMMIEEYEMAHTNYIAGLNASGKCYITFADQFLLVNKLLETHPTLWDEYGFKHIIVDEVQDSNHIHLELLRNIQNNTNYQSLCAVGDMQQSIYGFNNAEPENMQLHNYENYFGSTETVSIRENYRCSQNVIGFVNTVIDKTVEEAQNKRVAFCENEFEHLIGTRGETQDVEVQGFYTRPAQYRYIASEIAKDIEHGMIPGDIMFLARTKADLQMLASELTKLGIPSVLRSPVPYIENSNVASSIAFIDSYIYGYTGGIFDYLNQMESGGLYERADQTEIQEKMAVLLDELNQTEKTKEDLLCRLNTLDGEGRDECFQSFLENFTHCKDLHEIESVLRSFKAYGNTDSFKREGTYNEVNLSTIHSAKGLESRVVYVDIAKLDNSKYHESRRMPSNVEKQWKEDNRLEYVAYTRAKDKLSISAPYTLSQSKRDMNKTQFNSRLAKALHAIGKPFNFNRGNFYSEIFAEEARGREETLDETITYVMPTFANYQARFGNNMAGQMDFTNAEIMGMEALVQP